LLSRWADAIEARGGRGGKGFAAQSLQGVGGPPCVCRPSGTGVPPAALGGLMRRLCAFAVRPPREAVTGASHASQPRGPIHTRANPQGAVAPPRRIGLPRWAAPWMLAAR